MVGGGLVRTCGRRARCLPSPGAGLLVAGFLVAGFLAGSPLLAQRPVGLSVSVTAVDHETHTVDFDVTLATEPNPWISRGPVDPVGLLGDYIVTMSIANYTGHLLEPDIAAIDHGDGVIVERLLLPLQAGTPGTGTATYRGSFSHTYPAAGDYDLRAGAAGFIGYESTYQPLTHGVPVAAQTLRYSVYNPFAEETLTFTSVLDDPYVVGVEDSTTVQVGTTGGSGLPADVPTLSELALGLLALGLAGAGLAVLRR